MTKRGVTTVTELKRSTKRVLARLRRSRRPLLVTQAGVGQAMLVDFNLWTRLNARLENLSAEIRPSVSSSPR